MSILDEIVSGRQQERFVEFKEKAEQLENRDPEKAVEGFREAADLARSIAENPETGSGETWREVARFMDEKAYRIAEQPTGEKGSDQGSGHESSSGSQEAMPEKEESGSRNSNTRFRSPPAVSFSDVGGHNEIIQLLEEEVITQFEATEFRDDLGASPTNGVLMYGPPGTGKSLLAEAVAGEIGFRYAEVRASDLVTKYMGDPAKLTKELFNDVRKAEPCVLFVDEIDGLVRDREKGNKNDSQFQMISEFLQSMQDIQGRDVLVVGATNKLDELDDAVKRSGRFDEKIRVGLPNREARKQIFDVHLSDRAVDLEGVKWENLLEWTDGFTGSDIEAVVEKAARKANLESERNGSLQPVSYRHLVEAVTEVEASSEYWDGFNEGQ